MNILKLIPTIIFLFFIPFAHAAVQTQTIYFWLYWSGSDPHGIVIERKTGNGEYEWVAEVMDWSGYYRDTVTDDPGEIFYCYRLKMISIDTYTRELCETSPKIPKKPGQRKGQK